MKRKLSFLVATVMVLSMLPAMGVSAATKNTLAVSGGSVPDDYSWEVNPSKVPFLSIKEDSKLETMSGEKFSIELDNAEWDFDAMALETQVVPPTAFDPDTDGFGFEQGDKTDVVLAAANVGPTAIAGTAVYDSDDKVLYVQGNTGVYGTAGTANYAVRPVGNAAPKADINYAIHYVTDTTAEVVVYGTTELASGLFGSGGSVLQNAANTTQEKTVMVPLTVKMKGTGPATATIGDLGASGVTGGTYTFATGADGTTKTTIKDSKTTFSNGLTIPSFVVTETVPGTLKMRTAGKVIEFVAPNGFEWVNPTNYLAGSEATAKSYLGFKSETLKTTGFTYTSSDKQLLTFALNSFPAGVVASTTSSGAIEFTNLQLKRTDSVSETPTGPVQIKVNVNDGTNEYITVGEFAKRAVTLTAEDKALPEIVSGVYMNDAFDEDTQVLDVTLKEQSVNAWNTDVDAVLVLPDGVKFRAVEVKKADNVLSSTLSTSDKVSLLVDAGGNEKTPGASTTGELTLTDDKITISDISRKTGERMEIKLRCYVTVKPGFKGDIVIKTDEDNEAFSGDISAVVGKAIDPFQVTTAKTDVQLGYMNIPLGDVTLKENKAGAMKKQMGTASSANIYDKNNLKDLELWIGGYTDGVKFKSEGKYEVLSGDLVIDKIELTNGRINVKVKRASSTASELKLTGMTMDASRSVPEGKLDLRIGGSAVANYYDTLKSGDEKDWGSFDVEYYVADPAYVNIITAAPDKDTKYTTEVAVTVGSKMIKANGVEYALDVASYNDNGSVMVPVRAVSVALGVSDSQVAWDAVDKVVTITESNRGRTSQFQVGSNYINQSGLKIRFDGPPCKNVEGRVFLPFRALGELVLGCPVTWDSATTTAYFNKTSVAAPVTAPVTTPVADTTTAPATTPAA